MQSATDADDQRASFSSYGPAIDAAAPGVDIHSTYKDGTYITASGTSASTAFASGLAALLLSREPLLTPDEIEKQIQLTCDDVNAAEHPGYDEYLGAGRINAAKALAALPAVPQTIHAAIKYDYDQNGNLISRVVSKGKAKGNAFTTSYSYDYENRLTSIVHPDETASAYRYDGGGRRIQSVEDGVATNFLYDGLSGIIEKNEAGVTQAFYNRGLSYGGGIGGIISAYRNGTPVYYHYDGIGAVTGLTDQNGELLQSYAYDAFGNALSLHGNVCGKRGEIDNAYGFSTKEYNPMSGLIYFGARYYDPTVGRFITKDLYPGNVGNPTSLHPYIYCGNNPVNWIDPYGLCIDKGNEFSDNVLIAVVAMTGVLMGDDVTGIGVLDDPVIPVVVIGGTVAWGTAKAIEYVVYAKERSLYPPAKRKDYKSKKDAYEDAKKAGKGKEPIHHPNGEHGPHYHPNVSKPTGQQTPKAPNPHDHYNYPKGK